MSKSSCLSSAVGRSRSAVLSACMAALFPGHVVVVGKIRGGSVIASRQIDLPDGGELSIGIRSFRSGRGRILEGAGVTPDVLVEVTAAALRSGRDPMIEAAAARLMAGTAVSPSRE